MTLRGALATPESKRRYAAQLFSTIADRYDLITSVLSYGQDRRWKRRLLDLAALAPDDRLLDLACGTCDICEAALPRVRCAIGLDLTFRMLQLAQVRSRRRGGQGAACALIQGDMVQLPFVDRRFTVVTTGYGLRNVVDLPGALGEIRRVLTPGGRFLSLDFNRPEQPLVRAAYLAYLTVVGSALGLILHGDADTYRYIPETIRRYPGARGVAHLLVECGFRDVRVVPLLGGLMTLHVARRD